MDTKHPSGPPAYDRDMDDYDDDHPDLKVPLTDSKRLSIEDESRPLPEGWIRQLDPSSDHHFYVDTQTNPPRSIWVHPFEDPEWQQAHASRQLPPDQKGPPHPPQSAPLTKDDGRPLPSGWKKQIDPSNGHPFYIDTLADPPRTIWAHPFDDPQWQREQSHHASAAPPSPSGTPSSTQRPAPAHEDSKDPLTGVLAGGGAMAAGMALLGKYMENNSSKPSTPQQQQPQQQQQQQQRPPPQQPPQPPQQSYQNYPNYPSPQGGPMYQGGPNYYQGPPGPVMGGGLLGGFGGGGVGLSRHEQHRLEKEQRHMLREQEREQRHAFREERRAMRHGYGVPMYAPPPMAYGRQRTDYGMGIDGMAMGGGYGGGYGGGGRRHGGGMGLLGGLGAGMLLGDMMGDGGDGGGDDGGD
ncbi:hypothetical protein FRB98_001386 [Tulasnella sp. 332]|nr:hypothetical protein FRB98_001386 [Tulasnella sp. 332]